MDNFFVFLHHLVAKFGTNTSDPIYVLHPPIGGHHPVPCLSTQITEKYGREMYYWGPQYMVQKYERYERYIWYRNVQLGPSMQWLQSPPVSLSL